MALKLSAKDIKGVVSMHPTPSTPDGGDWRQIKSVDFKTAEKLWNAMIKSGTSGFALCGTTGENAALLWDEKRDYIKAAAETINKRAYTFAGATALGTKETIRQMRELQKLGVDGAFVGLPLWQTPTIENMNMWWRDLAEAVPDMPVMVYSNSMFFKTLFPVEFWEGVGKYGTTVVTNKLSYPIDHLADDIKAATDRVQFVPGKAGAFAAYKAVGTKIRGLWTTDAAPEPYVALSDAIQRNDADEVARIKADFDKLPSRNPPGVEFRVEFPMYNAQIERAGWNSSDFLPGGVGPMRPPYRDLPEHWVKSVAAYEHAWDQMRAKYIPVAAKPRP